MSVQPGVGEVLVVVATEQIDNCSATDFMAELAEGLRCCKETSAPDLVIDLSQVTFMDSSGIRALIVAEQSLANRGGHLMVCGAHDDVLRCLEITGMLDRFGGASANGAAE